MTKKESPVNWLFRLDLLLLVVTLSVWLADFLFHLFGASLENLLLLVGAANLLPVLWSAVRALRNRRLTIDLLASFALILSLLNREWHSAVFIGLMLVCARLFADFTASQARQAIQSLLKLRPERVHRKEGDQVREVPVEDLRVGDLVLVNDGERIPVDGVVVEGRAVVDQSSLTGESLPQNKEIGEKVFASTLSVEGDFTLKATRVGRDTTFEKIVTLVEQSQRAKASISSATDSFVNWYILLTVIGSLLIYFFTRDLKLLLAILLVTCADDLAVAIPLAFTAAIGAAARQGSIIKGSLFLEGLTKVRTVVLDKTGTLTQGRLQIQRRATFGNFDQSRFLSLAAGVLQFSNHPTAKAILQFVKERNVPAAAVQDVYEESGYGIGARAEGESLFVGRPDFAQHHGTAFSAEQLEVFEKEKERGRSVIVLSQGERAVGFFSLSDSLRPNAREVMAELRRRGVRKIVMLTGDNEKVAQAVAQAVALDEFRANLLPQDKIAFLKTIIQPAGQEKVLMVGDGVNDAPALVLADIGCAMGAIGSDAAIESSDIVLMKDDLAAIPAIFDLGRYTLGIVRQDLLLWGATNLVGLTLVFAGVLNPVGAAAFNFFTDFFPLLNSMKLFRMHLHGKPRRNPSSV